MWQRGRLPAAAKGSEPSGGRALAKARQRQIEGKGCRPQGKSRGDGNECAGRLAQKIERAKRRIKRRAGKGGGDVDLLAQDGRILPANDIADNAAECGRDDAEKHGGARIDPGAERAFRSFHGKKRQADGIRPEHRAVARIHHMMEEEDEDRACDAEI